MKKKPKARCPCCKGKIGHFPDQDGSCDFECTRCGWHQHVPGAGIEKERRKRKVVKK